LDTKKRENTRGYFLCYAKNKKDNPSQRRDNMPHIPVYQVLVGDGELFLFVLGNSIFTAENAEDFENLWWDLGILQPYEIKHFNIPSFLEYAGTDPFLKYIRNWSMLGDFDD
jgi:hypothetical protein